MSNPVLSNASSETRVRLFAAKIELLARHIPALAGGSTFLAVGSAFILFQQGMPASRIGAWLAAFMALTVVRVGVYRIYKSRPQPPEGAPRWAATLTFFSFLAGVIWGSLGVLFFVPDDPFTLALVTIILAAILASALNSLGPYWPAHVAFGIPCAVPFAIVCMASGRPPLVTLGALSLFFLVFTELFARSIARSIEESLLLRFENLELVAELKAARDRAESADLAKTRLLAAVSHDLRQPLHGMGLLAEAMEEQVLDLSAAEFPQAPIMVEVAQRMRTDFGAMEQLVNRLLEASRLQDGTVRVNKRRVALAGLLESVASTAGEIARAKGLSLRVVSRQEQVHSDPNLLYGVVANLVSNAVYTRKGGVLLACRRRGGRVRIEVWDTGIGIAPDEIDLIQGEYYRARNADEGGARGGGFGLGLSIVNRTAALLDLRLEVRSRLGRGSVFAVELPVEQVVDGE